MKGILSRAAVERRRRVSWAQEETNKEATGLKGLKLGKTRILRSLSFRRGCIWDMDSTKPKGILILVSEEKCVEAESKIANSQWTDGQSLG